MAPIRRDDTVVRSARLPALLLAAGRPLFAFHMEMYRREVSASIFPRDERCAPIAGPNPERIAFIGSVAVSGLGVLSHGMTTSSQTARRVARARGRGLSWSELTSPVLTARTAATMPTLLAEGASAAVVFLGIADVLSVTSADDWERDLRLLIAKVRDEAGEGCAVVFAAIPPMGDFRSIPPVAKRLIAAQIDRLNAVTERLARDLVGVDHVPFPTWELDGMFVQDLFSWSTMHRKWAEAVAPRVHAALDGVDARRVADQREVPAVVPVASTPRSVVDVVEAV